MDFLTLNNSLFFFQNLSIGNFNFFWLKISSNNDLDAVLNFLVSFVTIYI